MSGKVGRPSGSAYLTLGGVRILLELYDADQRGEVRFIDELAVAGGISVRSVRRTLSSRPELFSKFGPPDGGAKARGLTDRGRLIARAIAGDL